MRLNFIMQLNFLKKTFSLTMDWQQYQSNQHGENSQYQKFPYKMLLNSNKQKEENFFKFLIGEENFNLLEESKKIAFPEEQILNSSIILNADILNCKYSDENFNIDEEFKEIIKNNNQINLKEFALNTFIFTLDSNHLSLDSELLNSLMQKIEKLVDKKKRQELIKDNLIFFISNTENNFIQNNLQNEILKPDYERLLNNLFLKFVCNFMNKMLKKYFPSCVYYHYKKYYLKDKQKNLETLDSEELKNYKEEINNKLKECEEIKQYLSNIPKLKQEQNKLDFNELFMNSDYDLLISKFKSEQEICNKLQKKRQRKLILLIIGFILFFLSLAFGLYFFMLWVIEKNKQKKA